MRNANVLGYVDDNGEYHEGAVPILVQPKRKNGFVDGWVAMSQQALSMIARDRDLGLDAQRVLIDLMGRLDFANYLLVNQREISSELGMHPPNVSKAISLLTSKGILIKGPKAGRSLTFRLNPEYGWKGSAKSHQEALAERRRAAGITGVIQGGKGRKSGAAALSDEDLVAELQRRKNQEIHPV